MIVNLIIDKIKKHIPFFNFDEPETPITCDGCVHLCYNCDGSVGCNSPYENVCLKTEGRVFKELD